MKTGPVISRHSVLGAGVEVVLSAGVELGTSVVLCSGIIDGDGDVVTIKAACVVAGRGDVVGDHAGAQDAQKVTCSGNFWSLS